MSIDEIAVIVLAAGQSTRFGSSKMAHSLASGKSILETTLEQYRQVFTNTSVVVSEFSHYQHLGVPLVLNKHAHLGMSQSIIAGIKAQTNAKAWLIALGDMPYVKATTLKKCAAQSAEELIVLPTFKHQRGNPVIFGAKFRDQGLMQLAGDVGAKSVIEDNLDSVVFVPVEDAGVVQDIDRKSDILE